MLGVTKIKSHLFDKGDKAKSDKQVLDNNVKPSPNEVLLVVRIILGLLFLVLGFAFSKGIFFDEHPLFGVHFLAEVLISLVTGLFGFYVLPKSFSALKHWFVKIVFEAVSTIVSDFWEQQNIKIREARKEKDKKKKAGQEEEKKVREAKELRLKEGLKGSMVLDTSILVDGRILDIAKTGFLIHDLIVPDFVVTELHSLSDSKKGMKRAKGRRGLDVLKSLKKVRGVNVRMTEGFERSKDGVDKTLVKYAKEYGLTLTTLDFNLNKVASVSGVKVLNLNNLANALRMFLLPGEELEIKVVDAGQEKEQGVGYLEDGTMVVVAKGKDLVGSTVKVCVKKNIQGSAGKMIFAEIVKTKSE